MLTPDKDGSLIEVSDKHVVEIILDGAQWRARFEEKCKAMSSNTRMRPCGDVGNSRRRDPAFALASSGRHKVELEDTDGSRS